MQFWSLSQQISYQDARRLQLDLVELRFRNFLPDTVLILEHKPVITRGRGLQYTGRTQNKQMPLPLHFPVGISFSESERGGDLTYHGPGQLVVYPILKLDGCDFAPNHDVSKYLRKLEQVLISVLADYGLVAGIQENATGVWIPQDSPARTLKIASIGIAVRKWVSFHGMALNCVNDLQPFHLISPCGFAPEVMTRLADWVVLGPDWRSNLEIALAKAMGGPNAQIARLENKEIETIVDGYRARSEAEEVLLE